VLFFRHATLIINNNYIAIQAENKTDLSNSDEYTGKIKTSNKFKAAAFIAFVTKYVRSLMCPF
jgi:hypothetical protein